ncbi:MAG: ribonuclease HI [Treponema sp.]|jgi:ribonuclease HI|nr:ribonuclease HI [Treponema sp.]
MKSRSLAIKELSIYTDGGCSGNPGPGGWAYVIVETRCTARGVAGEETGVPAVIAEKWGAVKDTTNNRMEVYAAIAALEGLLELDLYAKQISLYTDSQYVCYGMSRWIQMWKKKGWRNSDRKPVKNRELWERLDKLAADFPITWKWVKGHAGNAFNERCDRMTHRAIASL